MLHHSSTPPWHIQEGRRRSSAFGPPSAPASHPWPSSIPGYSSDRTLYPQHHRIRSSACNEPFMPSPLSRSDLTRPRSTASSGDHATPHPSPFTLSVADLDPSSYEKRQGIRPVPGPASARRAMGRDAQAAARRKRFLDKVRQGGEERRDQARAADLERMDRAEWAREKRAWEEARLREAPSVDADDEEGEKKEEEEEEERRSQGTVERAQGGEGWSSVDLLVEDVAQAEQRELEALLSLMDVGSSQPETGGGMMLGGQREGGRGQESATDHFGSDDEDFEAALDEILSLPGLDSALKGDGDAMDLGG